MTGVGGRLISNTTGFHHRHKTAPIDPQIKANMGGLLKVNRGKRSMMNAVQNGMLGDRLSLPSSEPTASIKSNNDGFNGKFYWETPTIVAPIARASYAGGGSDSVPTVTPMTATQSRVATTLTKRRMARLAGKNYASPYQRPALYDRSAPPGSQRGLREQGSTQKLKVNAAGNMKNSHVSSNFHAVIAPENQDDISITRTTPNPPNPLPPTGPDDQQGNDYANYHEVSEVRSSAVHPNFNITKKSLPKIGKSNFY